MDAKKNTIEEIINLYRSGKLDDAKSKIENYIKEFPKAFALYNVLGAIFADQGKLEEAVNHHRKAVEINPSYAEGYNNLGIALQKLKQLDEAVINYKKALKLKPNFATAYNNLATALKHLNNLDEALINCKKAVEINPDFADAHNNLGNILKDLDQLEQSSECFKKAIDIKPDHADAYNNLGVVFNELGEFQKAISCYQKAIDIKPDYADAHYNLGNVLDELKKHKEAIISYEKVIQINPNYAVAHYNLGNVLKVLGEFQKAIGCYQKAINSKYNFASAYNNMLFTLFYLEPDPKFYLSRAKEFRSSLKPINDDLLLKYQYSIKPKKLRIGFVSGDFKEHPVGFFLLDTLNHLKNENLELIAYSNSKIKDNLSIKLKSHFTEWHEIDDLDDIEVINQIRKDGIHILFDLSGHSANNRLPIFVNKPAPLQVSWIGHLASTGIPEIDYIIGDPCVTPPESKEHFVEKILCLPNTWCFSKPDFKIEKIETIPALKNGFVTFGCFNNPHKLNEKVINSWAKILNTVPDSKLILKNGMFRYKLLKEKIIYLFKKHQINIDRLILEEGSPRKELLETYNKIDIALDPFPYSGGTTSCEAIWMEVPVLTKKGSTFMSRMTESINYNCGLPDWVAIDEKEYIAKAIGFSANLELLSETKKNLRQGIHNTSLFNASLFAKHFKDNMWQIWKKYINKNNYC
jgi:predicted O-linked N-acetylglucosamine transferase (SPINDLY family)